MGSSAHALRNASRSAGPQSSHQAPPLCRTQRSRTAGSSESRRSCSWLPRTAWNHGFASQSRASRERGPRSMRSPTEKSRSRSSSNRDCASSSRRAGNIPWTSPTTKSRPAGFPAKRRYRRCAFMLPSRGRGPGPDRPRYRPPAPRRRRRRSHVDPPAVRQHPELLQRFRGLESGGGKPHVVAHEAGAVGVEPEVPEVLPGAPAFAAGKAGSAPRDGGPAEVQGEARIVADDLDHVGVEHLVRRGDRLAQGRHVGRGPRREVGGRLTDERRGQQGFIRLHVDDDRLRSDRHPLDDFRDPFGPRTVGGGRAADLRIGHRVRDAFVVHRHDHPPRPALAGPFADVSDHRLPRDVPQHLVRQPRRCEPGWNHRDEGFVLHAFSESRAMRSGSRAGSTSASTGRYQWRFPANPRHLTASFSVMITGCPSGNSMSPAENGW